MTYGDLERSKIDFSAPDFLDQVTKFPNYRVSLAFDLVIADSDQAFLWKISEILDT